MKNKILLIAFCFGILTCSFGQNGFRTGYIRVFSKGNGYSRLAADSAIHIPNKISLTTNDIDTTPQVFVKNDTLFYFSNGTYKSVGITAIFTGLTVTPSSCPPQAATTISNVSQTGATVTWTPVGGNTYNISTSYGFSASNVSPPIDLTGLTANTAYTVNLTTVCTTGGTANYSTNNFTTTSGAPIQLLFAYSATDPYTDNTTAPIMVNPVAYTIAHNANLVFAVPAPAADNYLIVRVPATESTKLSWYYNNLNSGTIPDAVVRAPFTVSGSTYYVTRVTWARDPATTNLQFTNP